jgi:hypothetical protein
MELGGNSVLIDMRGKRRSGILTGTLDAWASFSHARNLSLSSSIAHCRYCMQRLLICGYTIQKDIIQVMSHVKLTLNSLHNDAGNSHHSDPSYGMYVHWYHLRGSPIRSSPRPASLSAHHLVLCFGMTQLLTPYHHLLALAPTELP